MDERWKTDEAALQREVLLAIGRYQRTRKDTYIHPNPVGQGYAHETRNAVAAALSPFGREAVQAALYAMSRHVVRYGDVGSPDLTGWVAGRWIGLELKRIGGINANGKRVPAGTLEDHQAAWHTAARDRGAIVEVVRSPEEVETMLERVRAAR